MSEWKPISLAPKDGTHILVLCDVDGCEPWQMVVSYEPTERQSWHWLDHEGRAYHESLIKRWMPLPPPPEN